MAVGAAWHREAIGGSSDLIHSRPVRRFTGSVADKLRLLCGALLFLACSQAPPPKSEDDAAVPVPDAPPPLRDWSAYPPVVEVDTANAVWVVGDIHGDYERLTTLLAGAGLVQMPSAPADAQWLGGAATLVCMGDIIDKWPRGLDVITYLAALGRAAQTLGGRVIVLMGNHEATFLSQPDDEQVADFASELRARGLDPAQVAAGGDEAGTLLRNLPVAARVNDWFFVHAGNTRGIALEQLKADIMTAMDARGFGAPLLLNSTSLLDSDAPWWEDSRKPLSTLQAYVKALGVQHIVQGHEPGKIKFADNTTRPAQTMFQKFGLIYFVDIGMSQGAEGTPGALLHIDGNAVEVVHADGTAAAVGS